MYRLKWAMGAVLVAVSLSGVAGNVFAASPEQALRNSMKPKNHVGMERIEQTSLQRACSDSKDAVVDKALASTLRQRAVNTVSYPADGVYLGDWRRGEAIAADGTGLQWTDDPEAANGGNCYACHQLDPAQVAYGTLGPSLKGYAARGKSEAVLKYTWAKIWNPHAYVLCSHMPRFGDAGILTADQIRDVMALLLDPDSPVNSELAK